MVKQRKKLIFFACYFNELYIFPSLIGGPAGRSGLRPGDRILKLDGYDVHNLTHNELITLLRKSGDAPTMVVETGPPLPSEGMFIPSTCNQSLSTG